MGNALGLRLISIGIGLLIGLIIVVQYMAHNHPKTFMGRICLKIDKWIDKLPEDEHSEVG